MLLYLQKKKINLASILSIYFRLFQISIRLHIGKIFSFCFLFTLFILVVYKNILINNFIFRVQYRKRKYRNPFFGGVQGKSSNNACRARWSGRQCQTSID